MQIRKEKVWIGDKEFVIRELSCAGRNALLDIVGGVSFSNIFGAVMPLMEDLGVKIDDGTSSEQLSNFLSLGFHNEAIWGGIIACVITILNLGPQVILLSLDNSSEDDKSYILENMTVNQEPVILRKIIELNKLPDTVKNYKSLLTEIRSLIKVNLT